MVVATADLPSHIQAISEQYPKSLGLTAEALAYRHTLFPLYAPFIPEARRLKSLDWMTRRTKGAVHLALGIVASRIRQRHHFHLCPECLEEQLTKYGEYYWDRQWQVTGCKYCLKHSELSSTQYELHNYHRHSFVALAPTITCLSSRSNSPPPNKRIEKRVRELLDLSPTQSPSLEQWSNFYRQTALDAHITKKSKVIYDALKHKILSCWPAHHLTELGIPVIDNQSNWLRLFMRKHRKTFSYLQHIVVLESLLGPEWLFKEVLSQVKKQTTSATMSSYSPSKNVSQTTLHAKREAWLKMVKVRGTRKARLSGGDRIYTWLYRNDRSWLKRINKKYRKTTCSENQRVNWHERDKHILERLEAIKQNHADKLDSPRQSKNWYCAQAGCRHMARKMDKLPLSAAFLKNNSEDVASCQIRRIIRVIQSCESSFEKLPYWKLLRLSGLSEPRLKERTREFLRHLGWPV